MTRSDALEPLSHDHHEALVFVAGLRRAHRAGDDPAPLAAEVAAFWRDHLVPHFAEEEAAVVPILQSGAPDMAARMLDEHRAIRALADAIAAATPAWDGPLGRLADVLAAHVRFEEREAFPAAERLASAGQLARLGADLCSLRTHRHP